MNPESVRQFLVLYSWFPLAVLLILLLLIGRIYQKFSGVRTFYWYFFIPMVIYGVASVRQASAGTLTDPLANVLYAIAGVILIGLCVRLFRVMLKNTEPVDSE